MDRPSSRALAGLALLSAINLLNFADRYVVGGVQELIKRDPALPGGARDAAGHLGDASLGALTTAFVISFMLASPVTGWLGDRVKRKYLVATGVLFWSLATFGSGLASSFGSLLAARACIGIGEAGYATVAPSLLADLFPPATRGRAMGVLNVVVPLGAALGFGAGGAVGAAYSWRAAFFVAGAPGLLLAVAALLMPEPQRGALDPEAKTAAPLSPRATLAELLGNRAFMLNVAGQVLLTFTVGGLANWMPSFLVRELAMPQARAGLIFGVITALAGILGTAAGAAAGERAVRSHPRGYFWVSGLSMVAGVPFVVLLARAPGVPATLGAAFVALFLLLFNSAPLYTALLNAVPAHLRASAVAFNLLASHILGDAISPPIIGQISDATGSLGLAVALTALPVLAGGLLLLWAARAGAQAQAETGSGRL